MSGIHPLLRDASRAAEAGDKDTANEQTAHLVSELRVLLPTSNPLDVAMVAQLVVDSAARIRRDVLAEAALENLGPVSETGWIGVDFQESPDAPWQLHTVQTGDSPQGASTLRGVAAQKFINDRITTDRVVPDGPYRVVFRGESGRSFRVTNILARPDAPPPLDPAFAWPESLSQVVIERGPNGGEVLQQEIPMFPGVILGVPNDRYRYLSVEVYRGSPAGQLMFRAEDFQSGRLAWRYTEGEE